MDNLLNYICAHAHHAPLIIFSLLLLTGFNIPISEDLLLIGGGAIAAGCIPEHTMRLFFAVYAGCLLSAWIAYWLGRTLGPRLYEFRLFKSVVTPHRLEMLRHYYAKFGIFTFIVGRFCPGGVRNALFISSGLTKMPFPLFIMRDGTACLISTTVLFTIGYHFGQNFDAVLAYAKHYNHLLVFLLGVIVLLVLGYIWYHRNPE